MQDRIEQTITVKAPIDRVWTAFTDYREFGKWFRVTLHGPLDAGQVTKGTLSEAGHEGTPFWLSVVSMQPPHRFSFDWPAIVDITSDMVGPGKTTRVDVTLEGDADGTRIVVAESGFAALPPVRAAKKLHDNTLGWASQVERIKAHVGG